MALADTVVSYLGGSGIFRVLYKRHSGVNYLREGSYIYEFFAREGPKLTMLTGMATIKFRDWIFDVDKTLTEWTYKSISASGADGCGCNDCKNYVVYRHKVFPQEICYSI